MKNVTWTTLIGLLLVVGLAACSAGGGTASTGDSNTDTGDTGGTTTSSGIAASAAFPRTLAITSPAATAGASSASLRVQQDDDRVLTPEEIVSTIDVILDVESTFSLAEDFDPGLLFEQAGDADCYGPAVVYGDHPDWTDRPEGENGELPVGDLGFWEETEGGTEACAAAQLNARIGGVQSRVLGAMTFTGVLLRVADEAGLEEPAVGNQLDITAALTAALSGQSGAPTITSATYERESAEIVRYSLEFEGGETDDPNVIELTHRQEDESVYQGFLYYRTGVGQSANNCHETPNGATNNGTLLYNVSGTDVTFESRFAGYCGAEVIPDIEGDERPRILLDPSDYSRADNPNGWGGNFEVFGGAFDTETLVGSYVYAWQAGPQDSYARTLVANVAASGDDQVGTAYFGYADDMRNYGTPSESVDDFALLGIFCNWTGPEARGNPAPEGLSVAQEGRLNEIRRGVQQQIMTRSGLDEVFTVSSSNIEYAPIKPRDPNTGATIDTLEDPSSARCTVPIDADEPVVLQLNEEPITSREPLTDINSIQVAYVTKTDELIGLEVYESATDTWVIAAPSNPFVAE